MEFIKQLLSNDYFVVCAMAVIIFGITQLLKLPIKAITKAITKRIKKDVVRERVRKILNAIILFIPFALGVLFEWLYSTYYLKDAFSVIAGLGYGTAGISLYSFVERFFKVKIPNPYTETEEGKAVVELVEDVTNNPAGQKDAVKDFWNKINK